MTKIEINKQDIHNLFMPIMKDSEFGDVFMLNDGCVLMRVNIGYNNDFRKEITERFTVCNLATGMVWQPSLQSLTEQIIFLDAKLLIKRKQ